MTKKVEIKGKDWFPFTILFNSPDGNFCFTIWAISYEHAVLQCEAVRETAEVAGQLISEHPL